MKRLFRNMAIAMVLFAIFACVIAGIIIFNCNPNPSDKISFLGSYFGGVFGGLGAIIAMHFTLWFYRISSEENKAETQKLREKQQHDSTADNFTPKRNSEMKQLNQKMTMDKITADEKEHSDIKPKDINIKINKNKEKDKEND